MSFLSQPFSKDSHLSQEESVDTEFETLSKSDLDLESNYMTGLEDFLGNEQTEPKEESKPVKVLSCVDEPRKSSSFIQDILYEDSRTGIAVVDLFVAVKIIREDLEILSRCNNHLFYKINDLNKETRVIKTEYRNLLKMMLEFVDKMNADTLIWDFPLVERKSSFTAYYPKSNETEHSRSIKGLSQKESQGELTSKHTWKGFETESQTICNREIDSKSTKGKNMRRCWNRCRNCKQNEPEEFENIHTCSMYNRNLKNEKTNTNCLGCIITAFKKIPFHQTHILPEALLGSFLASILWLLSEQENTLNSSKSSSLPSPASLTPKEEKESDETLENVNLSEPKIQMTSDVCEILDEATLKKPKSKELPHFALKKVKKVEKDLDLENWVSCGSRFRGRFRPSLAKTIASSEEINPRRSFLKEFPPLCNGTISSPDCLNYEKNIVESNESSKVIEKTENESSSEDESIFLEALTGPLMPLPQIELKPPSVTCMGDLTKAVVGKKSASTLTAADNTMDFYVERLSDEIQFKIKKIKSKTKLRFIERSFENSNESSKEVPSKYSGSTQLTVTANTPVGFCDVTVVQYKKNNISDPVWSDDSFHNSESEPVDAETNSVENDIEEFLEIYVGEKKSGQAVLGQEKGVLKKTELKTHKAHFFEIVKCCPVYSVQEIVRKTPAVRSDTFLEMEKSKNANNGEKTSCCTEEKLKKQVAIEKSSSDFVIYIQVEVEDDWDSKSSKFYVENQVNSLGTQTVEGSLEQNLIFSEKLIKLDENQQDEFFISTDCSINHLEEIKQSGRIIFEEPLMILEKSEVERKEEQLGKICVDDEKVLTIQESKGNSVLFDERLSETYIENEVRETHPEEEEEKEKCTTISTADLLIMMEEKQGTDAWFFQHEVMHKLDIIILEQAPKAYPEVIEMININAVELAKALNLIHEIENDIINVKLDDAISILPQLESELRKHLQSKIKNIEEKESAISVDNFFSTVEFWEEEEPAEDNDDGSEERLNNLLKLLSKLEKAVKFNEGSRSNLETCKFGFSKIYELLHALTARIRRLEEHSNVTNLSQILEIASQLDTAVREYDSMINHQPLNDSSLNKKPRRKTKSLEEIPVKFHLKNVRKKVFEIVEEEAFNLEGKIEADFDRLCQIEKENNEAMTFLEAFLEKTGRRVDELANLKKELKNLTSELSALWERCQETNARRREREMETENLTLQVKESEEQKAPTKSKEKFAGATVSGLLTALNNLKSRAREKKEVCEEILSSTGFERAKDSENLSRRPLRSNFSSEHTNDLNSSVKECKKIGSASLYLSWTEPEGLLKDLIVGYQIYVNGKLNQKVRNPQRLQAVLYSVDLTKKIQVQLYALAGTHPKTLLATLNYPNE